MTQTSIPPADRDHPYRWLLAFKEVEHDYFHGRKREVAELFQLVRRNPLTVLYGVSGLGKTSLLQAGLYRRLRDERYLPIAPPLKFPRPEDGEEGAKVDLVARIKDAVKREIVERGIDARPPDDGETLWSYFQRVTFWDKQNYPLIPTLVIDQFEEIFTVGAGRPEVAELITALGDLVENRRPEEDRRPESRRGGPADEAPKGEDAEEIPVSRGRQRVKVILSLREEYLARFDDLRHEIPSIGSMSTWYCLHRMNGDQALKAVQSSASHIVDRGVAEKIVRFVARADEGAGGRPGAGGKDEGIELEKLEIEPALLSVVCSELNERRLLEKQRGGKDVKISAEPLKGDGSQVLAGFYERCVGDLGAQVRAFVEDKLLTSDGRYRTTVARSDAESAPGMSPKVIDTLVNRFLLRVEDRLDNPHVELIHDRMIAVIRESRQERRRRRRVRWIVGLASVSVAALVAVVVIVVKRDQSSQVQALTAENARRNAREVAKDLQESGRLALLNGERATAARVTALACGFADQADGRTPTLAVLMSRSLQGLEAQVAALSASSASAVRDAQYSSDGELIATLAEDGSVRLWKASTGDLIGLLEEPADKTATGDPSKGVAGDPGKGKDAEPKTKAPSCRTTPVASIGWSNQGHVLTLAKNGCFAVWSPSDHPRMLKTFERKPPAESSSLFWKRGSPRVALCDLTSCSIVKMDESAGGADVHEERELVHGAKPDPLEAASSSDPLDSYLRWKRRSDGSIRLVSLAYGGKHVATVGGNNTVRVWDLETGADYEPAHDRGDDIHDAAWSGDGKWFAIAGDGAVQVYDVEARSQVAVLPHAAPVEWIAFDHASTHLVSVSRGGLTTVWDATKGTSLFDLPHAEDVLPFASFSHDGRHIVTLGSSGTISVWDSASGAETHTLRNPTSRRGHRPVVDLAPKSDRMVTGGTDGLTRVWDISERSATSRERILSAGIPGHEALLKRVDADEKRIEAIAFNPKKPQLATGGWDGKATLVKLGKIPTDAEIDEKLVGHDPDKAVADVEYNPEGTLLVTASVDRTARVWDAASGKELQVLGRGADERVSRRAIFHPDGKRVATAGFTGKSCLWDAVRGKRIRCFEDPEHASYAEAIAFGRGGSSLAVAYRDGAVLLYEVESGKVLSRLKGHTLAPESVEFDAAGDRVLTASDDGTARLWGVEGDRGVELAVLHHDAAVSSAHFGPGGRIVTASADRTAKVWDASGTLQRTLAGHTAGLVEAVLSADGELVLTASTDGTARLWKTETGALAASFDGHPKDFMRAEFTLDGRFVVTADANGDVRFWRMPGGGDGHAGAIVQALLSEDDRAAFTLDDEGCSMRWDLARPGSPPERAGCVESVLAPGIVRGGSWTVVGGEDATFSAWGPDGKISHPKLPGMSRPLLALGIDERDGHLMTVDARYHVGTWDLSNLSRVAPDRDLVPDKPLGEVWDAQCSADGQRVWTAGADGTVVEWDGGTFQRKGAFGGAGGPLRTVEVSDGGETIAGLGKQGLRVWRRGDDRPVLDPPERGLEGASISPDGTRVAAGGEGYVYLWDVGGKRRLLSGLAHMDGIHTTFDPTGQLLLSYDDVGPEAFLWNARTGDRVAELTNPGGGPFTQASWSPKGDKLATVSKGNLVYVWDAGKASKTRTLQHGASVVSASFGPDGQTLVTAGDKGEMRVWDLAKESAQPKVIETGSSYVWSAVYSPVKGKIAAIVYGDADKSSSRVGIWDAATGTRILFPPVKGIIYRVRWNRDGTRLLSLSRDHVPRLLDAATETLLHTFDFERVIASALTTSGPRVVTGDTEGMVRVYGEGQEGERFVLPGDEVRITVAALGPGGAPLVVGGDDGFVAMCEGSRCTRVPVPEGHSAQITGVAWSPDAKRFVAGAKDGAANLWSRDGAQVATLSGHTAAITSVGFDPHGYFVITASQDGTARVWQADDGTLLAELHGHPSAVRFAGFGLGGLTPGGTMVATTGDHGFIRLWDFHPEESSAEYIKSVIKKALPARPDAL